MTEPLAAALAVLRHVLAGLIPQAPGRYVLGRPPGSPTGPEEHVKSTTQTA